MHKTLRLEEGVFSRDPDMSNYFKNNCCNMIHRQNMTQIRWLCSLRPGSVHSMFSPEDARLGSAAWGLPLVAT